MPVPAKINHIRHWNLPGSPDDPRLLHSDPSDVVFIYPDHLCQGYSQEIRLQDDITLGIIDRTLTQAVMMDAPRYGHSIEFEFQLAGPQAGYSFFYPHLRVRDLHLMQPSSRTFKVEIFLDLPVLMTYFQAFLDSLPPQRKILAERFLWAIYRYYSGGVDLNTASITNRLFDPAANPYVYLPFEQILSDTLYSDIMALAQEMPCPITPAMMSVIGQILNCPYSGATRRAYLRQKALTLVSLYLEAFKQLPLNNPDFNCIYQAEAILRSNIANPPTLDVLARQVGTNRRKLNEGFHQVYGTTPFGYLRNCRLNQAKWLLMTSECPVEEIASVVGYTSRSRFATAFRQQLGINPKAFQIQAWQCAS
ncbi:MAG: AraC family transcriptional regulator [Cyanobacteria bacterium J06639_16]